MSEPRIDIPAARREPTDIGERLIWMTAAAVVGVLALCGLMVFWLYPQSRQDRALSLPLPLYPAPRLQPSPSADMQAFHAAQLHALDSSGWVDQTHGIVHIPISEAMRIVAREGVADWPTPGVADQAP